MFAKFVTRFAIILFVVIALMAMLIQFIFPNNATTLWILMMPAILGIPMLASIVLATDEELNAV